MSKIEAVNKHTGEHVELQASNQTELVEAWRIAQEYAKVADRLKAQLKELVPKFVGDKGISEEVNGHIFRVSNVQRKTYDKAVLRQYLDEDTFDLMMKPDKKLVDNYIKENLEELGDASTAIRNAMVDDGKPYQMIKLEKVVRDE